MSLSAPDIAGLLSGEPIRAVLAEFDGADVDEYAVAMKLDAVLRRALEGAAALALKPVVYEILSSRRKAARRGKFDGPNVEASELFKRFFFTRVGYEAASCGEAAVYRAGAFDGYNVVCDMCAGVGVDTAVLAASPGRERVFAIEKDPLTAEFARFNLRIAGVADKVDLNAGDIREALGQIDADAWFFNPSRRRAGARAARARAPHDYEPTLHLAEDLARDGKPVIARASPMADSEPFEDAGFAAEFVSVSGEVKELVLYSPDVAASCGRDGRRATVLPSGETVAAEGYVSFERLEISEPLGYIFDTARAVRRAGLVDVLGARLGMNRIDADAPLLTSAEKPPETGLGDAYRVVDVRPFSRKALRRALVEADAGRVVVRKRGFPVGEKEMKKMTAGLSGRRVVELFATRAGGRPAIIQTEKLYGAD